jgi:hypothetical protein
MRRTPIAVLQRQYNETVLTFRICLVKLVLLFSILV